MTGTGADARAAQAWLDALRGLPGDAVLDALRALPDAVSFALAADWQSFALAGQRPPPGDWRIWLLMAGRGYGKTRAGAEWVSALARADGGLRIALVGATLDDVRQVMVEGESGILAVARAHERPRWYPSRRLLRFSSGAEAYAYSAERPDGLRGPQHHHGWCDELAKWRHADAAWDNLRMGMRLGTHPRLLITTTPRPTPLLQRILGLPDVAVAHGRTAENPHLAAAVRADLQASYGGTRLGRQELDGEMLADVEGALWTRAAIEAARRPRPAGLARVVIGVDPPASAGGVCGLVVAGADAAGQLYVLGDASLSAAPHGWAAAVAAAARDWQADLVVAEANQGGDMVGAVLAAADVALPLRLVHASRGKAARAEPVALLFERGTAFLAGCFPALEDQMAGLLAGGGYAGPGRSPDRADAMVWAMTALIGGARPRAAVSRL